MKFRYFLLLFLPALIFGQQSYRSPYLSDPSLLTGYVDSCAAFWTKVYDAQYGGYYTNINRTGGTYNTAKHTMNNSRDAYGFIRAYQMTGKQIYLKHARQALQFIYAHSWDTVYGGWYNTLDRYGNPSNRNENKTAFYQHYALLGIAAMYEATRDSIDWHWLMKGYSNNEAKFWDSRPAYYGYFDRVAYNGTSPSGKTFNSTVDAITTHVLHLYLMTKDERYLTRLKEIAENMKSRLMGSMASQAIGFAEHYDSDWKINPAETMTIMGHILKTAWCFVRVYHFTKDPSCLTAAEQLADHVLLKGYDSQYGGPYKDYNRTTGQMLMWGIQDTAKAWWQMEQAVTAGLTLYHATGKQKYLTMADETLDFFMKYFVDHTYGDVYENRARNGNAIQAWGTTKGNDGKAAYHSIETGYYAYLYQSLMVAKSTATLYYYFTPSSAARNITLHPLSFPDYRIKNVFLNDTLLAGVDQKNSAISLAAGQGGTVRAVFEYFPASTAVARTREISDSYELAQNYPNPFNPSTTISYRLPENSFVSLKIYDILGREIKSLVNAEMGKGVHNIQWNGTNEYGHRAASGTYIIRIKAGSFSQSRKILMIE